MEFLLFLYLGFPTAKSLNLSHLSPLSFLSTAVSPPSFSLFFI